LATFFSQDNRCEQFLEHLFAFEKSPKVVSIGPNQKFFGSGKTTRRTTQEKLKFQRINKFGIRTNLEIRQQPKKGRTRHLGSKENLVTLVGTIHEG